MEIPSETVHNSNWLDRPISTSSTRLTWASIVFGILLILTIASRFYHVDLRVMSHDEVNHVVPGFDLLEGRGYRHDPVTHGPMQFHLLALSYFILGDNDFSARVPAVLFSIATVIAVILLFPRYLGKTGAFLAGLFFMISPYMLFYGRYTRNEAFVGLFGVLTLYGILRYLDRGDRFSLFLLTAVTAFHFATKETSFIYTAQMLLFFAFLFIDGLIRLPWPKTSRRNTFLMLMVGAILLLMIALGAAVWSSMGVKPATPPPGLSGLQLAEIALVGASLAAGISAVVVMLRSLGLNAIRSLRSFDLLILTGTLILPMLAPFPVKIIGQALQLPWNPLSYSDPASLTATSLTIAILALVAIGVGLWWKPRLWLANFALFYAIFGILYTTFFTNGFGFITGLVGSLGYWLDQQDVQRGTQPLYYYLALQIPVYEYLAAAGTLLAVYFGVRYQRFASIPGYAPAAQPPVFEIPATVVEQSEENDYPVQRGVLESHPRRVPTLALLVFWAVSALVAYSAAGEKMPWLTVHIALPMLLAAGWGIGFLVDTTPWRKISNRRSLLAVLLTPVFLFAAAGMMRSILGANPPFQGNTLEQLRDTSSFLAAIIGVVLAGGGILYLLRDWRGGQTVRLVLVSFFAVLALLTARHAAMASYINYDSATEFLVYAHAAPAPKKVMAEIEEISRRLTGGTDMVVAYDNEALYPYWWYLRHYDNKRWFNVEPTRDLRDVPVIIAGSETNTKVNSITEDTHVRFDYIRLWWPNQEYYGLTGARIKNALFNRELRSALFAIWLNRDYTKYAALKETPEQAMQYTPEQWSPSSRMNFYVRNDVAQQIWSYGATLVAVEETDPYAEKLIELTPDRVIGLLGTGEGQFNTPHDVAIAPDGTLYVADSNNHRIQHLTVEGEVLHVWGSFGNTAEGEVPGGRFNEPWGVAVSPDGTRVYVTDTWNHRVQMFTAEGELIRMWGYFGQAETPDAFWGPRDIAVDTQGRVYVTDTGNKRIAMFDADGTFLAQFGSAGFEAGEFDEPMGIGIGQDSIYVADTWNQRMQRFAIEDLVFIPTNQWDVDAWTGKSLQNYPFVAVDPEERVYVSDPEGYRVLVYNSTGEFLYGWGGYSSASDGFGLAAGVAVDDAGGIWVSDAGNHTLLHFDLTQVELPASEEAPQP